MEEDIGIGALIRDLRDAHGWSQSQLADRLCRRAGHATLIREEVSRWERGRRRPGPFWLWHLAAVLDVPLEVMEAADVDRRSFLTGAAATIVPLVSADLVQHGFAAALREDRPSLDDWQARTERYGRDYLALGAAEVQRRLAADLLVLHQGLESPGVWAVAATLMTLFGKTVPGGDGSRAPWGGSTSFA